MACPFSEQQKTPGKVRPGWPPLSGVHRSLCFFITLPKWDISCQPQKKPADTLQSTFIINHSVSAIMYIYRFSIIFKYIAGKSSTVSLGDISSISRQPRPHLGFGHSTFSTGNRFSVQIYYEGIKQVRCSSSAWFPFIISAL